GPRPAARPARRPVPPVPVAPSADPAPGPLSCPLTPILPAPSPKRKGAGPPRAPDTSRPDRPGGLTLRGLSGGSRPRAAQTNARPSASRASSRQWPLRSNSYVRPPPGGGRARLPRITVDTWVIISIYQTRKISEDHPCIWRYTARRALVIFDHPYNGGSAHVLRDSSITQCHAVRKFAGIRPVADGPDQP